MDLIIGGASNYTWNELKYWVNSIKRSGFKGDVVLVATNINKETIDKLTSEGVKLELYGRQDGQGGFLAHSNGAPHVERFFYIYNYLMNNDKYRYVITTDTRDVVFQSNPSDWLKIRMTPLVISSEGLQYKNEPWGYNNLLECFGPFFQQKYADKMIYNVGTIAGYQSYVASMMLMIFQMSVNRPIKIVDQAVFNFMVHQEPFNGACVKTNNTHGWAIQLGTTEAAIKAGHGDIGFAVKQRPELMNHYYDCYTDEQPHLGYQVTNSDGTPFVIVHQYDRVPELKEKFDKLYGD